MVVLLGHRGKPRPFQLLVGVALFPHCIAQRRPGVRREADAELGQRGFGHAPFLSICQALCPGWGVKLSVEKPGRLLGQRPQALLQAVAVLILLVLRHLHPGTLGQGTDSVRVAQSLNLHLKIDDAAALVAAKTIENSLVRRNGEGRRLFAVKRAQAKQIGARAPQIHILAHHILDRVAGGKLRQK